MTESTIAPNNQTIMTTDLPLVGRRQGKVRDIYECQALTGDQTTECLLIIASDRISAFDVIMTNGVPGKGIVLTQISKFWFDRIHQEFGNRLQHHLISTNASDVQGLSQEQAQSLSGRVMVGRKTKVVPIECVVRGYLAGSGWRDYQKTSAVCGIKLPSGLTQCEKLPEPLFTPATKADEGHDENISFEKACELVGKDLMATLRDLSIQIYQMGHDYAASRGIILADTKFEFGLTDDGQLLLIDEVLTMDSSRFWPADKYESGRDQESYDKEYVRSYLSGLVDAGQWDKTPPGPALPEDVIRNTLAKYQSAYHALVGTNIEL